MKIGVIGGSGIYQLSELSQIQQKVVGTPYGEPSSALSIGRSGDTEVVFLARHGAGHTIPPHRINYRANIWALHNLEITHLLAFAAVGGITASMVPERLIIPDQIIDYTYGREHTFFADDLEQVSHIDFSMPYDAELRTAVIKAARQADIDVEGRGVYGATQGPRLETAAEINRMERDGCDIVGMTGMPEAALAREIGLPYATVAVVANWAAGRGDTEISMDEILQHLDVGMASARNLLQAFLRV